MARRAAAEIKDGDFVNFGIGVPTLITNVLAEEKRLERVTLSIESGTIGGAPQGGLLTGAAYNADAMIKQPDIFDLYDGGGIDVACLGGAEFDREGNVNVSRFGEKIPGPAGSSISRRERRRRALWAALPPGKARSGWKAAGCAS